MSKSLPVETVTATLDAILARARSTALEASSSFPNFAPSEDPRWVYTPDGGWTGGFFVGQLWFDALISQDPMRRRVALDWANRISPRAESASIFRGFLFWYGLGMDVRSDEDERLETQALRAARALASDFNHAAHVIPLGRSAEEAHSVGDGETNIDGVPGTILLLDWAARRTGDSSLRDIAIAHVSRHIDFCMREDGGVIQSASFDPVSGHFERRYTHKGFKDDSIWTRAQAWGMLGFAQATRLDRVQFLAPARATADWWVDRLPSDNVARWDFDDPDPMASLDTSGTAIAAVALLELAEQDGERATLYRSVAERMISALVSNHVVYTADHTGGRTGRLIHGTYNQRIGLAIDHELIWGSYFLTEALARLAGKFPLRDGED